MQETYKDPGHYTFRPRTRAAVRTGAVRLHAEEDRQVWWIHRPPSHDAPWSGRAAEDPGRRDVHFYRRVLAGPLKPDDTWQMSNMAERALIVDDNPQVRSIIRVILERFVREVSECPDGETALRRCAEWRPDLVLVDYEMRPIDGIEFTRKLRQRQRQDWWKTTVVMVTAKATAELVQRAADVQIDGFLVKPLEPEAMAVRIRQALDSRL